MLLQLPLQLRFAISEHLAKVNGLLVPRKDDLTGHGPNVANEGNLAHKPASSTPGAVYELRVDLVATAKVFAAGHRIRLEQLPPRRPPPTPLGSRPRRPSPT
jgi:hypothetical protein